MENTQHDLCEEIMETRIPLEISLFERIGTDGLIETAARELGMSEEEFVSQCVLLWLSIGINMEKSRNRGSPSLVARGVVEGVLRSPGWERLF